MSRRHTLGLVACTAIVVVACGAPSTAQAPQPDPGSTRACTQEAKVCPDGTAVSRQGPDCEFAACPNETKDGGAGKPELTPTGKP